MNTEELRIAPSGLREPVPDAVDQIGLDDPAVDGKPDRRWADRSCVPADESWVRAEAA